MRALYVSQNGMAENLGQSQVLPYLRGLARRGVEIDLFSFELPELGEAAAVELAHDIESSGIRWHRLSRQMRAPLQTKFREAGSGLVRALGTAVARRPDIVHGRSYFATAICDALAQVSRRSKLLFDCRGMIGDEYVDCGYWTKDRVEYRMVKRYERRLFTHSDGVVVLTRALRKWLRSEGALGALTDIEVVPCCVDMDRFQPSEEARRRLRAELGLGDRLTVLYAGSLGSWYLEPEMARFAECLRVLAARERIEVAFVCFTPSDASGLRSKLESAGFAPDEVVTMRVPPKRMPEYLAVGDIALSFIQSCFSKKGSSPTKVAEYLACGNVAVVNGDIGDQADLAVEQDSCVVLDSFADDALEAAASRAIALARRPYVPRARVAAATARRHFGLEEVGIERYARLYERLMSGRTRSAA